MDYVAWQRLFSDHVNFSAIPDDPPVLHNLLRVAELGRALERGAAPFATTQAGAQAHHNGSSSSTSASSAHADVSYSAVEACLPAAVKAVSVASPAVSFLSAPPCCDQVRLALLWMAATTTTTTSSGQSGATQQEAAGSAAEANEPGNRPSSHGHVGPGSERKDQRGDHSAQAARGSTHSKGVDAAENVGCLCTGGKRKKRSTGSGSTASASVAPEPLTGGIQTEHAGRPGQASASSASVSAAHSQASAGAVSSNACTAPVSVPAPVPSLPPPLVQQGTDDPIALQDGASSTQHTQTGTGMQHGASFSTSASASASRRVLPEVIEPSAVSAQPVQPLHCSFGTLLEYIARGAAALVTYAVLGASAVSPSSASYRLPGSLDEVLQGVERGRHRRPPVGQAQAPEIVKLVSSESLEQAVLSNASGPIFAALASWASSSASATHAAEISGQLQPSCLGRLRETARSLGQGETVHVPTVLGMLQGARSAAAMLSARPELPSLIARAIKGKPPSLQAAAPILASVCSSMAQTFSVPLGIVLPSSVAVASHSASISACVSAVLQCLWKGDPSMAPPEGGLPLGTLWAVLQLFSLIPTPAPGAEQGHAEMGGMTHLQQLSAALCVLDGRALSLILPPILRAVVDTGRLLVREGPAASYFHGKHGAASAALAASSATRLRFAVDRQRPVESVLQAMADLQRRAAFAGAGHGSGAGTDAPVFGDASVLHPLFASIKAPVGTPSQPDAAAGRPAVPLPSPPLAVEAGEGHGPRKELLYLACLQATGQRLPHVGDEPISSTSVASSSSFLSWQRESSSHAVTAQAAGAASPRDGKPQDSAAYALGWLLASSCMLNGVHVPPAVLKLHPVSLLHCFTRGDGVNAAHGPGPGPGTGIGIGGACRDITVAHLREYDPSALRTLQNIHNLDWDSTLDMLETEELCLWAKPEHVLSAASAPQQQHKAGGTGTRQQPRMRDWTDGVLVPVGTIPGEGYSEHTIPIDLRIQEASAPAVALLHRLYSQRIAARALRMAHATPEGSTLQALCLGLRRSMGASTLSALLTCPKVMLPVLPSPACSTDGQGQGQGTQGAGAGGGMLSSGNNCANGAGGLGLSLYELSSFFSACDDATWEHALPLSGDAATLGLQDDSSLSAGGAAQPVNTFLVPGWYRISLDPELSACTPLLLALWTVLASLSAQQQRAVLSFLTGLPTPPVHGTEVLRFTVPYTPLTRGEKSALLHRLPAAHTCHNTLEFPNYYSALKAAYPGVPAVATSAGPGAGTAAGAAAVDLPEHLKAPLPDELKAALERAVAYWHSGPSAGSPAGVGAGGGGGSGRGVGGTAALVSSVILPADKAVTQATLISDPFFLACVRVWSEQLSTAVSCCVGYGLDTVQTAGLLAPPSQATAAATLAALGGAQDRHRHDDAGAGKRVGIASGPAPAAVPLVKRGTADATTTALLHAVAKRLSDPHIHDEDLAGGAVPRSGQQAADAEDSDDEFLRTTRKQ